MLRKAISSIGIGWATIGLVGLLYTIYKDPSAFADSTYAAEWAFSVFFFYFLPGFGLYAMVCKR